jgi:2-polyprenyl-3-methyl-5-hydroxy-6-metoxy-1,4-benzoquinol methylase
MTCHLCNGSLYEIKPYSQLIRVISDCRPWRRGGKICVCQSCGTVQKPVTENWLRETKYIYSDYVMYGQGGGAEQLIFDPKSGASTARTRKIVSWLSEVGLPEKGRFLDVGCGNGAFLQTFSSQYPAWQLTGLELGDRNQALIESIPSVTKLHVGRVEDLNECFDTIALIYVLEHIPDPVKYLKLCSEKLNMGGRILLQVPDLEKSPFDVLVADHCTHFSMETLQAVVTTAGFELIKASADALPKELTLLAQWQDKCDSDIMELEIMPKRTELFETGKTIVEAAVKWLEDLICQGQNVSDNVGIFGTSISATWLAASLGDKVIFFVDEDSNRAGRTHMGKPIYYPESVLNSLPILMPLIWEIADNIVNRYPEMNLIMPPKL